MMADIEAIYYQVRVPDKDTDLLRFLWWPKGDLSSDIAEFKMVVHLFGATKWTSNSRVLLASVPDCARAKVVRDLDLIHDSLPVKRAL